jgi:hypothetical protein
MDRLFLKLASSEVECPLHSEDNVVSRGSILAGDDMIILWVICQNFQLT